MRILKYGQITISLVQYYNSILNSITWAMKDNTAILIEDRYFEY